MKSRLNDSDIPRTLSGTKPAPLLKTLKSTEGLIQAFVTVGLHPSNLDSPDSTPTILWEYANDPELLSPSIRSVLPDFCFPLGIEKRRLKMTGSASDFNKILYGQTYTVRNHNCFTFTIRMGQGTPSHPELPNCNKDVMYVFCVQIDDIVTEENKDWIVSKCYCVLSYFPLFELHYELVSSILLLKRFDRM